MRDKIEMIAVICHEANKVWCHLNGDASQPHWGQAPAWQVESAIVGVMHALKHPDATPEDVHGNWMTASNIDGSGRQIIIVTDGVKTIVRAGCFAGSLTEFAKKANAEGKYLYASMIPAMASILMADCKSDEPTKGAHNG